MQFAFPYYKIQSNLQQSSKNVLKIAIWILNQVFGKEIKVI